MQELLSTFENQLVEQEKSKNTVEKYLRDVTKFLRYLESKNISFCVETWTPKVCISYKQMLLESYQIASVNSMLGALNLFLKVMGREDCVVRTVKQQRKIFLDEDKLLNKMDYERLINTAREMGNSKLALIMETIGATGIRISELSFITVQALKKEQIQVNNKGKSRTILVPKALSQRLKIYASKQGISNGVVFVTRGGKPMNRSNLWKAMKHMARNAGVMLSKVFPHNLRHFFATTYYKMKKDIVTLADILGHSNIETTRIYTRISSRRCAREIERLGLVLEVPR